MKTWHLPGLQRSEENLRQLEQLKIYSSASVMRTLGSKEEMEGYNTFINYGKSEIACRIIK